MRKSLAGRLAWVTCVALLTATLSCSPRDYSNTSGAVAIYDGFGFRGNPNFSVLVTGGTQGPIPPIYVELNDGSRYLLSELPEEVVAKILRKSVPGPPSRDMYGDGHSLLDYRDGKLFLAALDADSGLFAVSPHKDGPYLKLPIERKRLIEVFGEPQEWGHPPKLPTGP